MLKIYCDGACSNNPGIGGWGAVLIWKEHVKEISGNEVYTTNNRMEITAAIKALSSIVKPMPIAIYTDSTYLKDGITKWIHKWKVTNWNNGKIKNIDLWKQLDSLISNLEVEWHWVKAHNGDFYNEIADKLAKEAINNFRNS